MITALILGIILSLYITSVIWCYFEIDHMYSIRGTHYGLDFTGVDYIIIVFPIVNLIVGVMLFKIRNGL
jgi:hypothetical protein